MAEPTITKDKFIIDHVDFGLREQVNYPNGGTSKFYDNGTAYRTGAYAAAAVVGVSVFSSFSIILFTLS